MKVIEKPLIVNGEQLGVFLAYENVEPELSDPQPRDRVLPAPFFYEKRLFFFMIKKHEPGERFWPKGGYEVRDESGGIRCYDLDQVILHPAVIKHKKTLEKMARKAEKEQAKRDRALKRGTKPPKEKTGNGRRGRKPLDPAIKAAREAEKAAKRAKSGGRRGRPKSEEGVIKPPKKSTGGRRGRPEVSPEVIAKRIAAKAAVRARTGGKRGRPKNQDKK